MGAPSPFFRLVPTKLICSFRLRRPPDGHLDGNGLPLPPENRKDAFGGQMGRFSVRNPGDRNMRLGGDDVSVDIFIACLHLMPIREQANKGRDPSERKIRKDDGEWRRAGMLMRNIPWKVSDFLWQRKHQHLRTLETAKTHAVLGMRGIIATSPERKNFRSQLG